MPSECQVYGDNYYVTTNTGKVLFSKSGVDNTLDEAVLEKRIVEFVKDTIYNFDLNLDIDYDCISITDEFVNGIETNLDMFLFMTNIVARHLSRLIRTEQIRLECWRKF